MTDVVTATDNISKDSNIQIVSQNFIDNTEINGGETPYIMPRQTGTGLTRGIQTIAGELIITDPTTNKQIMTITGTNGYQLFTNPTTGVNQIITGFLPDGTSGMVISKPGIDVLSTFS